jgi:integrase
MPRTAILKPAFRKARAREGLAAWAVNVPPELSPTGRRQELFFSTKGEASGQCERLKARKDNFGLSLAVMTSARIAAAAEAYKLLDPLKIDLLDAVRSHIQVVSERTASVTFDAAFARFAELKADKSAKYRQEIRQAQATFAPLLEWSICDIRTTDLEPILDKLPAASRNAKMRRLRSVFNLAIKRQWMRPGTSPIGHMDFVNRPGAEVETIPGELVSQMLGTALENDLGLVPFLTLAFFCGIRPRGELEKLEWRDVDLWERSVTIRPEVSKTNRRRFVDLSENAIAWLEAYRQRGGTTEGRIVPFTSSVLRKRRRLNWRAVAGERPLIQQGARHTFCSAWLAKHSDINKMVLMSGHQSVDIMFRCYHKGMKKVEAEKFWSIIPPSSPANVVAFAAPA